MTYTRDQYLQMRDAVCAKGGYYVLERNRPLPHEVKRVKACSQCDVVKPNTFDVFGKVPYGDKKLGRESTGPCCRGCISKSIVEAKREQRGREQDADRLIQEDVEKGAYLAPKSGE